MTELYPEIAPYNSFFLNVGSLHNIYVEEVGNPQGIPVIFVHGGPGGGLDPRYRRYFNPKKWRVILFDQRGCGRSKPFGELKENTTFDLVSDMEKIREHCKVEKWHVFGGSWGSTLSLAYAISHEQRVSSLMLRGIFLLRKKEIHWFYQEGASYYYPEEWEEFLAPIPESERHDLVTAYHKRLNGSDQHALREAARAWSKWEGATSKLIKNKDMVEQFSQDEFSYAFARIENHYFINKGFLPEDNWILNNSHKIKDIPGIIVQGRYDMPCPPMSAYELHKAWPKAQFHIIEAAGHSMSEPGITKALLEGSEAFSLVKS
jgi:proline iminopeptidase